MRKPTRFRTSILRNSDKSITPAELNRMNQAYRDGKRFDDKPLMPKNGPQTPAEINRVNRAFREGQEVPNEELVCTALTMKVRRPGNIKSGSCGRWKSRAS